MAKAVFVARIDPAYDDEPERHYHFPRMYLSRVERTVGDLIVYYEPRHKGGRQSYFATAKVTHIAPDPVRNDHFYAYVSDFLSFPTSVYFRGDGGTLERRLSGTDGDLNVGLVRQAVRMIEDDEYEAILAAAFRDVGMPAPRIDLTGHVGDQLLEDAAPFERPMIESILRRPFREIAFKRTIKTAYADTCLITGLRLINGGGNAEIDAAHIRPVGEGHGGSDSVRNGLALSKTAHWLFDRGLISLTDDHRLLVARDDLPKEAFRLFAPALPQRLPADPQQRPFKGFLKYHRDEICAKRGHRSSYERRAAIRQ